MAPRRISRRLVAVALGGALSMGLGGCLVPHGQPVAVDNRAGSAWSGDGVLLETSPDGERCRVALRATSLLVERRWVPCRYVHPR